MNRINYEFIYGCVYCVGFHAQKMKTVYEEYC